MTKRETEDCANLRNIIIKGQKASQLTNAPKSGYIPIKKAKNTHLLFQSPLGLLNIISSVQTQSHAVYQQKAWRRDLLSTAPLHHTCWFMVVHILVFFPLRHTHSFHINRSTAADTASPPASFDGRRTTKTLWGRAASLYCIVFSNLRQTEETSRL